MSLHLKKFSLLIAFSCACGNAFAQAPCDKETMDAFAYEDCIAEQKGEIVNKRDFSDNSSASTTYNAPEDTKRFSYNPFFDRDAYLTSSFGENRGTRYHAGIDYSTNMEEGWPIMAPENGYVKELQVSPFGYGKVMFFQGKSGKTWVFAHQSSFGKLDYLIKKKQYSSKRNDVSIKPGKSYRKGDTLTFSGSTGIGNPHLHLEIRQGKSKIVSPLSQGVVAQDTIAPQILGVAVWQGNDISLTSPNAFSMGCAETPIKNDIQLSMAVKIVDYSREPKDNPMAIRSIKLWRYDERLYTNIKDTLNYKNMLNIRNELLWAEEADTAGDWHFINTRILPLATYKLEIEDFSGHKTSQKFNFQTECRNNSPVQLTKNQTAPVFTFLSKTILDISRCDGGYKFKAMDKDGLFLSEDLCAEFSHDKLLTLGKVAKKYPTIRTIQYSAGAEATGTGEAVNETIAVYKLSGKGNISWNARIGNATITQKITGLPVSIDQSTRVLAVTKTHTDSLDFFEFHPKGLQFYGKWNVCIDNPSSRGPLYWLGESTRNWFYFGKQSGAKKHCANANELRDLATISNEEPMDLGFPYWSQSIINGRNMSVLKIPLLFKYTGIASGNSIVVRYKKKWIAAEYDSEPRELIIAGDVLPEAGEQLTIFIYDEAKRKITKTVEIPGT